jgi:hypothetical protein
VSGSFATYAEEFVGPWAGFMTGWSYWFMHRDAILAAGSASIPSDAVHWRLALSPAQSAPALAKPVLFAIAADAMRYYAWIPANQGYRFGVFNPIDGVGTPFFGGYYGSANDSDDGVEW